MQAYQFTNKIFITTFLCKIRLTYNIMTLSSASSVYMSSVSDTDNDSSVSDIQISQLQAEILQQSKDIEKFIQSTRQDEDNASLTVLRSLFILFKSELSVNLKLRKLLVDERKKVTQMTDSIKAFFHLIHKSGYSKIKDFSTVVDCLIDQNKQIQSLLKSTRQLKEEKNVNKKLISEIAALEEDVRKQEKIEKAKEEKMNKLLQEIDICKKNNEVLTLEINEKGNKLTSLENKNQSLTNEKQSLANENQSLVKENQSLVKENTLLSGQIEELKKELNIEQSKNLNKSNLAKYDDSKPYFICQIQALQKEVQQLQSIIKDKDVQKEREIADLNAQNIIDIQNVKCELVRKIDVANKEKDELECGYKNDIELLNNKILLLQQNAQENVKDGDMYKAQIRDLHIKLNDFEAQNSELTSLNSDLKKKIKKIMKKVKRIQNTFENEAHNHENEIEKMQEKMKNSVSNLENDWSKKLNQAESTIRQLQNTNDEQKNEMNALRDLIRKLSFNLQQEEAENARLQASMQVNQYCGFVKGIGKPKKVQKKGSLHDYSSPSSSDSYNSYH
ncbi:hypothetical protein TRFO_27988 [Tritrichomonas foetus]|uniref:Uncharacterized protein n=1 Tax=Tritrichomonas foetus TaxID=1144522 RepID=A0A1J4JZF1_9EUKA|nr:hypothetical protein TRFO_27988 [Tritrichomonas foetus]|eukprot:OHT04537.1 hypothetical protein TRFO_27988 [Tritrichomonas foetus]